MRALVLSMFLLAAAPARSEEAAPAARTAERSPRLGLMLDAGVPDGAVASAVYRPWDVLLLSAGVSYNGVAPGIRGGVTVRPFRLAVAPTMDLEAGHSFEGAASDAVKRWVAISPALAPFVTRGSYDYATAQLGIEIGDPRRVTFFVKAGMGYCWVTLQGTGGQAPAVSPGVLASAGDWKVTALVPTARLGLVLFLGG